MGPATLTLGRASPLLSRFTSLSHRPISKTSSGSGCSGRSCGIQSARWCCSVAIRNTNSSFRLLPASLRSFSSGIGGIKEVGLGGGSRASAVSGGGNGGGAGDGNSGGGGGDGGETGDGGSGNKWSFLSWYLGLLKTNPVLTKALTSASLTLIGDLICQVVIDQVPSLDLNRTFVFTFLGMALVGPTLHFWYLYLSKLVTVPGVSGTLLRLLLDQFVFAPTFIGVFLTALVTMEGRPSQVVPRLKQEWWSSVIANWQLWIPFQFLNFRFVPQQFQVLAANVVSLVWNVILSFKAHKEIVQK
uniref:Uncharacterized protein n=1 Tax=Kalanchoe fedtschenkoi TaxID=63787 RepID=A0A7N0THS7_KALFE